VIESAPVALNAAPLAKIEYAWTISKVLFVVQCRTSTTRRIQAEPIVFLSTSTLTLAFVCYGGIKLRTICASAAFSESVITSISKFYSLQKRLSRVQSFYLVLTRKNLSCFGGAVI